jgi:WD40 repeat protein
MSGHRDIRAVALDRHGNQVAVADRDQVIVHGTTAARAKPTIVPHKSVNSLAFFPDGRRLGMATHQDVTLVESTTQEKRNLVGALGPLQRVAISPDGQHLALASRYGIRLWSTAGRALAVLDWQEITHELAFGPDGRWLVVAGLSGVALFSLPQARRLRDFRLPDNQGVRALISAPTGNSIVAWTETGHLIVLDPECDDPRATLRLPRESVDVMAASPDGQWLATGGETLAVRRLTDASLVTSHPMNRRITTLAWIQDSTGILAGGDGGAYFMRFENRPT